jgi:hypothetical protein
MKLAFSLFLAPPLGGLYNNNNYFCIQESVASCSNCGVFILLETAVFDGMVEVLINCTLVKFCHMKSCSEVS